MDEGALMLGARWPEMINVDTPLGSAATMALDNLKVVSVHSGKANFEQVWEGLRPEAGGTPAEGADQEAEGRGLPRSPDAPGPAASSQSAQMPPPENAFQTSFTETRECWPRTSQ